MRSIKITPLRGIVVGLLSVAIGFLLGLVFFKLQLGVTTILIAVVFVFSLVGFLLGQLIVRLKL